MKLSSTQELVKNLYKDASGNPILLSQSQDEIFRSIAKKEHPRVHIMCHTRFGKSFTVALALLTRVATYPEKWALIAPTREKAKIIMDYVIQHIFDNDFTQGRFLPDKGENIESIRRYRNKNRINFKVGTAEDPQTGKEIPLFGELFIGAAKDALGFGAENVVEDEAAIIPDDDHSLVMRMLGDNPTDNFMVKIGNPFNRNHFLKSYHDPAYKKIIIDCYQSLKEGRITEQTIEENKPYSFFGVLYECRFPRASDVDESGWQYLFNDKLLEEAQERKLEPHGARYLGLDVARGGRNDNVWCLRQGNVAKILRKDKDDDLTSVGDTTINLMRDNGIDPSYCSVDDGGVGGGVTDYMKYHGVIINPVMFGERSEEDGMLNKRAEMYAGKEGLLTWLKTGGALEPHKDWSQLVEIRYKKDARGNTKLESKEDMRKRGVESPDAADALALTFARKSKKVYHGVDVKSVLESGAPSPFGGVEYHPGMPG